MQDQSPRLALPFILPSQAQKHVTHNEALSRLDMAVQLAVEGIGAATPPALPEEGQIWALGSAPTGGWAGQAGMLAGFMNEAWQFMAPGEGWLALDKSDGRLFRRAGGDWVAIAPPVLDNLDGVGINASHDAGTGWRFRRLRRCSTTKAGAISSRSTKRRRARRQACCFRPALAGGPRWARVETTISRSR
ncbi:MAG: DUF2793 domain-containing protein [Roseovarius sp.]|nr:DUF2793 domain-containing protein [Roseovarius sp.]